MNSFKWFCFSNGTLADLVKTIDCLWLAASLGDVSLFSHFASRTMAKHTRKWPRGRFGHVITDHDPPDVIGLDKKILRCHWLARNNYQWCHSYITLCLHFFIRDFFCLYQNSRIGSVMLPPRHPRVPARVTRWQSFSRVVENCTCRN